MPAFGFLMLGTFIGWLISYGIYQVPDVAWSNPGTIFNAVIAAAFSGGVFIFIQWLLQSGGVSVVQTVIGGKTDNAVPGGIAIFFYPVGLAYGALCNGLGHYIARQQQETTRTVFAYGGLIVASGLLLALLFWLYKWLPYT